MKTNKASFFERLTGSKNAKEKVEIETVENFSDEIGKDLEEAELAIDMQQTPTEIIIKTMVAGVRPEDLQISISREMIMIKGTRNAYKESGDGDFFTQELYWGSFARTVMLPAEVDADNAEAIEKHGLLTIRLPKIVKDKTKSLKVKSV